jgi:putative MFS transporter
MLRGAAALPMLSNPIVPLSLLIVGTSAVISTLLPYSAESYRIGVRGRATGWVADWSKIGGLIAQGLSALAAVPALGLAAAAVALRAALALLLILIFGRETRGRDLRELEQRQGTRAPVVIAR